MKKKGKRPGGPPRSPAAKALREGPFRLRRVESAKAYGRKGRAAGRLRAELRRSEPGRAARAAAVPGSFRAAAVDDQRNARRSARH